MTKGEQISVANGVLNVPNNPIIPFIEGDGIGPDIVLQGIRLPDKASIGLLGKMTESSDVIIVLMLMETNPCNGYSPCKKQGCPVSFSEFNKEGSIS